MLGIKVMNSKLMLVKIDSMTSLEIAEAAKRQHSSVLRDIRKIIDALSQDEFQRTGLYPTEIEGIKIELADNGMTKLITLDKTHSLVLTSGYSIPQRKAIIARWQFLEDNLKSLQLRTGTKKHQLDAMEALCHLLPDDLSHEELSYIKANTIVNKAVSNLFGFPKMLKKDAMSDDMLVIRENILDDYIKLYEVLEDNSKIKDILYIKYQPMRLEAK